MENEKQYVIKIDLKWDVVIDAENITQAIEYIKNSFEREHNLDLDDSEIVSVELVNNEKI